jgi:RNA polymerase sigma-70 factor (ECF subfamily)
VAPVNRDTTERERFEAAFQAHHRRVLSYALRRVASEADAEDVVAETFGIAWRRIDRLPELESLPWLLAVARRVIANHHRGQNRRSRLDALLHREARGATEEQPQDPALDALAALPHDDQELLRLLAWDGLSQADAGIVLGISANAVAIRLHRARKRFAAELGKGSGSSRTSVLTEGQMPSRRPNEERGR